MRLSLVFPQLIVDIMASSLMDLVHILVKHSQNGSKHLSGIVLAIPKEEWVVLLNERLEMRGTKGLTIFLGHFCKEMK